MNTAMRYIAKKLGSLNHKDAVDFLRSLGVGVFK